MALSYINECPMRLYPVLLDLHHSSQDCCMSIAQTLGSTEVPWCFKSFSSLLEYSRETPGALTYTDL